MQWRARITRRTLFGVTHAIVLAVVLFHDRVRLIPSRVYILGVSTARMLSPSCMLPRVRHILTFMGFCVPNACGHPFVLLMVPRRLGETPGAVNVYTHGFYCLITMSYFRGVVLRRSFMSYLYVFDFAIRVVYVCGGDSRKQLKNPTQTNVRNDCQHHCNNDTNALM